MSIKLCVMCGRHLTDEEEHYYGNNCETCEGNAFYASEEPDPARAALALPSGEAVTGPSDAPYGWLYDWTHSSALDRPDEHFTSFVKDKTEAEKVAANRNFRAVFLRAPAGSPPVAAPADGFKVVPAYWEWRHFDAAGYPGGWSDWQKVEPRQRNLTVDDRLQEFRDYIARGLRYELRQLFAAATTTSEAAVTEAQVEKIVYVPVANSLRDSNWRHPGDKETRTAACLEALAARGDDEGQGLDGYWKWGFAAGFNAALSASQAHGKSEAVAYPAIPTCPLQCAADSPNRAKRLDYITGWTDCAREFHAYADATVALRAQRLAAPADGAALAEPSLLREIMDRCMIMPPHWLPADLRQRVDAALASAQGDAAQQPEGLREALDNYLEAQDALDNREYGGVNGETYETCMRRRNAARRDLDAALAATPVRGAEPAPAHPDASRLQAEVARLNAIINTPHADDFLRAASIEAEHQRQRWPSEHDAGKTPANWFWLIGYLAGKALHAEAAGNMEKAEHHVITTGAACLNWHRAMFGRTNMRPGHEEGTESDARAALQAEKGGAA